LDVLLAKPVATAQDGSIVPVKPVVELAVIGVTALALSAKIEPVEAITLPVNKEAIAAAFNTFLDVSFIFFPTLFNRQYLSQNKSLDLFALALRSNGTLTYYSDGRR
jgi:hypothetical protein